jgi:5-methylcytosine-specific restriction endonuclease McrA
LPMLFAWDDDEPRRRTIPKAVKITVWNKYIGSEKPEGKCYVCKRTIHVTDFDLGHNKAVAKGGGDNINNLRPICRTCNSSMGTMSIERFKAKYFEVKKPTKAKPVKKTITKTKTATKKTASKTTTKKPIKRKSKKTTNIWGL